MQTSDIIYFLIRRRDEKKVIDTLINPLTQTSALKPEDYKDLITFSNYSRELRSGELYNPGFLAKIEDNFTVGKFKHQQRAGNIQDPIVYIKNNSSYNRGIILDPFSKAEIQSLSEGDTAEKTERVIRAELIVEPKRVFERLFNLYYGPRIMKPEEKDNRLIIYSINKF